MKKLLLLTCLLAVATLAQTKVGSLDFKGVMPSTYGYSCLDLKDSVADLSNYQKSSIYAFASDSTIKVFAKPTLSLRKSLKIPSVGKFVYVHLTNNAFDANSSTYEPMFSVLDQATSSYQCLVYNETGSQIFTSNGFCSCPYVFGGKAYFDATSKDSILSVYELRSLPVLTANQPSPSSQMLVMVDQGSLTIKDDEGLEIKYSIINADGSKVVDVTKPKGQSSVGISLSGRTSQGFVLNNTTKQAVGFIAN